MLSYNNKKKIAKLFFNIIELPFYIIGFLLTAVVMLIHFTILSLVFPFLFFDELFFPDTDGMTHYKVVRDSHPGIKLYRWANSKEDDKSGALSMWEDK